MEILQKKLEEESNAFGQNMTQSISVLAAIKPETVHTEKV
jgi:hypothetical protein